jgi:hypothetical protein
MHIYIYIYINNGRYKVMDVYINGVIGKWCSVHGPCNKYVTQQENFWQKCFICGTCRGVISRTNLEFS